MAHLAYTAIAYYSEEITAFDGAWVYDLGVNTLTKDPDYTIIGAIQDSGSAALQSLPEAQRLNVAKMLHTKEALKTATNEHDKNTYIVYREQTYKVINIGDYSSWNFYRYGLQKVESMDGR